MVLRTSPAEERKEETYREEGSYLRLSKLGRFCRVSGISLLSHAQSRDSIVCSTH